MSNRSQIWVHPEFKKMLKQQATDRNQSVLDFTKCVAKEKKNKGEKNRIDIDVGFFW